MKTHLVLQSLSAIALISLGIFCFRPNRNWFGNVDREVLKQTCTLPNSGTIARLYEGQPTGTTVEWHSVTFEESGISERQIFYTYGYPSITMLKCQANRIGVDFDEREPTKTLTIDEIRQTLIHRPTGIYKGKVQKSELQPLTIIGWTFGTLCLLTGGWLLLSSLKQFRQKPL